MMRRTLLALLAWSCAAVASAQSPTLDIYHVDVEGGTATLVVTPAREAVLVDTGWPGRDGRDASRIQAAMRKAGVDRIDHLILTHYHTDHIGGVPQLLEKVTVGTVHDHGPMTEPYPRDIEGSYRPYLAAAPRRETRRPGDVVTLKAGPDGKPVTLTFIAAHGEVRKVPGAPANPACGTVPEKTPDTSDNGRSVAFTLAYGDFDFFAAGDLTWNFEAALVCPNLHVKPVDVFQVTHHGADESNHPLLVRALAPTVAIMNNGARKGGAAATVQTVKATPSVQAFYQLHRNVMTGPDDNTSPDLIANLEESPDDAHMITVHVEGNGKYAVVNHRTGNRRTFTSTR